MILLLELLSARWGNQVYKGASENVVLALCFGALIQHGAFCARFYEGERIVFVYLLRLLFTFVPYTFMVEDEGVISAHYFLISSCLDSGMSCLLLLLVTSHHIMGLLIP